jgi:hypothetical protein
MPRSIVQRAREINRSEWRRGVELKCRHAKLTAKHAIIRVVSERTMGENTVAEVTATNIHLIGGEKGGVGKSLLARLLAQYMIDNQIPFLGFDSDRSHGALLRFYSGYASQLLIDSYESLDAIVEAATEHPGRRVLVDLAAQTQTGLTQWMEESQLLEVAPELGLHIQYWHVMDSGKDSVDLLKRLLDMHGAKLNYVLVLNEMRSEDFRILDESGEKERALALGAHVMRIKRLDAASMIKIDAASASFWAVANQTDTNTTGLRLLERQRVKVWLRTTFAEIARIGV